MAIYRPSTTIIRTNEYTVYQLGDLCHPKSYEMLLDKPCIDLKDFIASIGLPDNIIKMDEYWNKLSDSNTFVIVNKNILDWLGYDMDYNDQRKKLICLLKNNYKVNIDYKITDGYDAINLNPSKRGPKEKNIFITHYCLKNIALTVQTKNAHKLRESHIIHEMIIMLYMKYQNDLSSKNKDLLLKDKDNIIDKLNKKILYMEKCHNFVKFEINESAYYIISYGRLCHSACDTREYRKHGIAIKGRKGSSAFDNRLKQHRTTFRALYVEFVITAPPDVIIILEQSMEVKFGKELNPSSGETFKLPLNTLKESAIYFLEGICQGKYTIIDQKKIDEYNNDVDNIIKHDGEDVVDFIN